MFSYQVCINSHVFCIVFKYDCIVWDYFWKGVKKIISIIFVFPLPQVHIRVASPPIRYPCYMGINIPTKEELIANKPEFQDIAGYIGKD